MEEIGGRTPSKYCRDKGLVEAEPIKTEQDDIVDYTRITITTKGIDYLKGKDDARYHGLIEKLGIRK